MVRYIDGDIFQCIQRCPSLFCKRFGQTTQYNVAVRGLPVLCTMSLLPSQHKHKLARLKMKKKNCFLENQCFQTLKAKHTLLIRCSAKKRPLFTHFFFNACVNQYILRALQTKAGHKQVSCMAKRQQNIAWNLNKKSNKYYKSMCTKGR